MAYKGGYGTKDQVKTMMISMFELTNLINQPIQSDATIKVISGKKTQITNMNGFMVFKINDEGKNEFTHIVNAETDGRPIGYDVDFINLPTKLKDKTLVETFRFIKSSYKQKELRKKLTQNVKNGINI